MHGATLILTVLLGASKGGVTLPDSINVNGEKLVLNGLGIREATVFNVDVYVAGLYLTKKTKDAAAIIDADAPKKLVLRFVRDVEEGDLTKAWKEGFQKSGGKKLSADLAQLNGYMSAMKSGEELAMTYLPGKGTRITVKGKMRGTIAGVAFARVMWRIFLGPNPPNEGLKAGLLGG